MRTARLQPSTPGTSCRPAPPRFPSAHPPGSPPSDSQAPFLPTGLASPRSPELGRVFVWKLASLQFGAHRASEVGVRGTVRLPGDPCREGRGGSQTSSLFAAPRLPHPRPRGLSQVLLSLGLMRGSVPGETDLWGLPGTLGASPWDPKEPPLSLCLPPVHRNTPITAPSQGEPCGPWACFPFPGPREPQDWREEDK